MKKQIKIKKKTYKTHFFPFSARVSPVRVLPVFRPVCVCVCVFRTEHNKALGLGGGGGGVCVFA